MATGTELDVSKEAKTTLLTHTYAQKITKAGKLIKFLGSAFDYVNYYDY